MDENRTHNINATAIIGCRLTWAAVDLFVCTFLIAQLLYITEMNFAKVALFYAVIYVSLFICYEAFAPIVKRFSATWVIRFGAGFNVALACLLCAFHEKIADLYLLFALLNGIASGIYWIGINGFMQHTMAGTKMLRFQSYISIAENVQKIITPVTLGAIITYVSFFVGAVVAVCIGAVLMFFTLLMRGGVHKGEKFDIGGFVKLVKTEKLGKPVMLNFLLQFVSKLYTGCGITVVVLIAIQFGNSFSLGSLISVFAVLQIIMVFAYRMIKSRKVKNTIFFISACLCVALSCGLLYEVNYTTVLMFQFAVAVLLVIPSIECNKLQMDVMREIGHPEITTESLCLSELAYFLARISFCGLIILGYYFWIQTGSIIAFSIINIALMATTLVTYFIFRLWWKLYGKMIPRAPIPVRNKKTNIS